MSTYLDPSQYLTGQPAFEILGRLTYKQRQRLGHDEYHDWLIVDAPSGGKIFYRGQLNSEGQFFGIRTKGKGSERTIAPGETERDLFPELRHQSERTGNGVWCFPGVQYQFATLEGHKPGNTFTAEFDEASPDPESWQWIWERIDALKERGAPSNYLVASAGKCDGYSPHATWHFDSIITDQRRLYLGYLFSLLGADPAPARNLSNQFRIAGFYRRSKQREQGLFREYREDPISPEALIGAAQSLLSDLGIDFETENQWTVEGKSPAKKPHARTSTTAPLSDPEPLEGYEYQDSLRLANEVLPRLGQKKDQTRDSWRPVAVFIARLLGSATAIDLLQRHNGIAPDKSRRMIEHSTGAFGLQGLRESYQQITGQELKLPSWWGEKYGARDSDNNWKEIWRDARKITPDVELEERYLTSPEVKPGEGVMIASGMDTGKTTWQLREVCKGLPQGIGYHFSNYRNSLGANTASKCEQFQREKLGEVISPAIKLSDLMQHSLKENEVTWGCVDSLTKLSDDPDYYQNKVLVIDETESWVRHLLFSDTLSEGENRASAIERLHMVARNCQSIVAMDANATDLIRDYIEEISGKKITVYKNNIKPDPVPLTVLDGVVSEDRISPNDRSPWLLDILTAALQGQRLAIASDSQKFCERLHQYLNDHGIDSIFRHDGTTSAEEDNQEFSKDPSGFIEKHQPQILIYSGSAESGLDIPNKDYFAYVFGFYFGVVGVNNFCQMLRRIRDLVPRKVWINSNVRTEEEPLFLPQLIEQRMKQALSLESNLALDDLPEIVSAIAEKTSRDFQIEHRLALKLLALRNIERRYLKDLTLEALSDCGYVIEHQLVEKSEETKQANAEMRQAKDTVFQRTATEIADAPCTYVGKPIPKTLEANKEEQRAIAKATLIDRLPELPVLAPLLGTSTEEGRGEAIDFIKMTLENPGLLSGLELMHLAETPDQAKILSRSKLLRGYLASHICPWDMGDARYLKARALARLGITSLVTGLMENGSLTAESPAVVHTLQTSKQRFKVGDTKFTVFSVLKTRPTGDGLAFVASLLRMVGIPVGLRQGQVSLNKKQWARIAPLYGGLRASISRRFDSLCTTLKDSTSLKNGDGTLFYLKNPVNPLQEETSDHVKKTEKNIYPMANNFHSTPPHPVPSTTPIKTGATITTFPEVGARVALWDEGRQCFVLATVEKRWEPPAAEVYVRATSGFYGRHLTNAHLKAGWLREIKEQPKTGELAA